MNRVAVELAGRLRLCPHPEGGYFRETHRSPGMVPGNRPGTMRNASTAVLFLVPGGSCSRIHRLASDEEWRLLAGGPIDIVELPDDAPVRLTTLGHGLATRHVVPAGTWFGARVDLHDGYALVECVVTPGFDFSDFELASRDEMLSRHPAEAETIKNLT